MPLQENIALDELQEKVEGGFQFIAQSENVSDKLLENLNMDQLVQEDNELSVSYYELLLAKGLFEYAYDFVELKMRKLIVETREISMNKDLLSENIKQRNFWNEKLTEAMFVIKIGVQLDNIKDIVSLLKQQQQYQVDQDTLYDFLLQLMNDNLKLRDVCKKFWAKGLTGRINKQNEELVYNLVKAKVVILWARELKKLQQRGTDIVKQFSKPVSNIEFFTTADGKFWCVVLDDLNDYFNVNKKAGRPGKLFTKKTLGYKELFIKKKKKKEPKQITVK